MLKNIIKWIWWQLSGHTWLYHNPYNRRCTVCNRHEVAHYYVYDRPSLWWWSVFNDGDITKHLT